MGRFGADVGGSLIVRQLSSEWRAEIAGRSAISKLAGDAISFELPDGKGSFQGKFDSRRTKIAGHWIQPATVENGTPYALPVTLIKDKQNIWRGEILPLDDTITFYLMVKPKNDGSIGAFLRNPERNLGKFIRVDHIEREGESVKFFAADSADAKGVCWRKASIRTCEECCQSSFQRAAALMISSAWKQTKRATFTCVVANYNSVYPKTNSTHTIKFKNKKDTACISQTAS